MRAIVVLSILAVVQLLTVLGLGVGTTHTRGLINKRAGLFGSARHCPPLTLGRCQLDMVALEGVKNFRDIQTAAPRINIISSKVFRTGCVSKASQQDAACMLNDLSIKSLIDLRSPAEIDDDEGLHTSPVYSGIANYQFDKKKMEWKETGVTSNGEVVKITDGVTPQNGRKRFFVSLMSESLIKRGVFFRFRKRIRFQALAWLALSNFSRRAEKKVRSIFIDRINSGGLSLLNELVVDYSGKEIISVLKLLAEKSNYPVALYCTAGKDRTGLIAMLTLSVLGATDEEILADYVLSDSAYKELNDKKAMVVGMKQTGVDPDIFLRAKPQVMKDSINYIRTTFGSINGFLDQYGFDESWRMRLRSSLLH